MHRRTALTPKLDADFKAVPEGTEVDGQGRVQDLSKIVQGYGSLNIHRLARGKWVGVDHNKKVNPGVIVDKCVQPATLLY